MCRRRFPRRGRTARASRVQSAHGPDWRAAGKTKRPHRPPRREASVAPTGRGRRNHPAAARCRATFPAAAESGCRKHGFVCCPSALRPHRGSGRPSRIWSRGLTLLGAIFQRPMIAAISPVGNLRAYCAGCHAAALVTGTLTKARVPWRRPGSVGAARAGSAGSREALRQLRGMGRSRPRPLGGGRRTAAVGRGAPGACRVRSDDDGGRRHARPDASDAPPPRVPTRSKAIRHSSLSRSPMNAEHNTKAGTSVFDV